MTDLLLLLGVAGLGAGLGFFDWRLAVLWAGALCLLVGLARLKRGSRGRN